MSLASEQLPSVEAEPAIGPRLYGVVDVLRTDRIAGWAIDRADSTAAVEVDILREGRVVATVRADRLRRDLERGGVGTGRYGFVCLLDPPLEPGFEFTVAAMARAADGTTCELRRAGAAGGDGGADRRLIERIFEIVSRPSDAAADQERLWAVLERLEVAQVRIEKALGTIEPPTAPSLAGLKVLLGLSLGVGLLSLGIGVASMLQP